MTTTPQAASVLPEYLKIGSKLDKGQELTALERFIYDNEPAGEDEVVFREQLNAVVIELRAALDAHKAGQEPVYQYRKADGSWIDQSKSSHDYNVKHGADNVRILYTAPEAAAPAHDIDEAQIARMTENGTKAWAGVDPAALRDGSAPELVGWQPIETAPDDMTECVVVRWINSDGEECRDLDHKEDGCWMGWHEHAEHVQMIGGHGVSYTPPYAQWLQLPPAVGEATSSQPEKGNQP